MITVNRSKLVRPISSFKMHMKYITLLLLLSVAATLVAQQNINLELIHDGINRAYTVHLPTGYTQGQSLPVVFNMHGFGSNRQQQQFYAGMDPVADANNFIVVYPDGVSAAWNVGWNFGSTADDVGFIDALIDRMISDYNIDANRVYATGMSNGGFMSYVLACALSNRITAIASVTGGMVPGTPANCNPERTVPIMQVHGTADGTVPYNGSAIVVATEETVDFWVGQNNCNATPTITPVPNVNTTDGSTAENFLYTDCDGNTTVELYKITGGGHTWPGADLVIGSTNQDFDASEEIWRFFSQFQLGGTPSSTTNLLAADAVSVFPNPFGQQLNIMTAEDLLSVRIYSLTGRLLINQSPAQGNTVNTATLKPGVYLVRVETGAGVWVERVVRGR